MKAINVTEFKANLSKYLRMASRGTRVVVNDRNEPIAQVVPPDPAAKSWRDRLAQEGRLRVGSQRWGTLTVSKLDRQVDIQAALRAVREESR